MYFVCYCMKSKKYFILQVAFKNQILRLIE